MAAAADDDQAWARSFLGHEAIQTYDRRAGATNYEESADRLRRVIRSGLLRFTDLRDRPGRFFEAHRLLASRVLGGFGIRFTVQFNLFAGSVLGLGTPAQVARLDAFQRAGALGCFALTEVGAGVSSGLVVETTATYDVARGGYHLRTPTARAAKNWISQGLTAEYAVVMADLVLPSGGRGGHYGPHPFLMKMRDGPGGALAPGVSVEDMGGKTVANDLDNARITFGDGCFLPAGALLGRFCAVAPEDGAYVSRAPNGATRLKIEVIGQRLLTGRLCIASAALVATRVLFARTRSYTDVRRVAGQGDGEAMTDLPQLADLYRRTEQRLARMERFCASVERDLSAHLRAGTTPPDALVEAIGVAKIRAIRAAIEAAHELKHEVGSFALMRSATDGEADSIHGDTDLLWCCKFAEGDTRILLQKFARDRLKRVAKTSAVGLLGELAGGGRAETWKALRLAQRLAADGKDLAAWHRAWIDVYGLAEIVCDRHIESRL